MERVEIRVEGMTQRPLISIAQWSPSSLIQVWFRKMLSKKWLPMPGLVLLP